MKLLQQRNPLLSTLLVCTVALTSCMKAEQISLDSSSPQGLLIGEIALSGFGGSSVSVPPGTTSTVATLCATCSPRQMAFDSSRILYVTTDGGLFKIDPSQGSVYMSIPSNRGLTIDTGSSPNVIYTSVDGRVHKAGTVTGISGKNVQNIAFATGRSKQLFLLTFSYLNTFDANLSQQGQVLHQLPNPAGIAYSPSDEFVYVTENATPAGVYRWNINNMTSPKQLVAGGTRTSAGTTPDGVGADAFFESPEGIAVDSEGSVYVAEYGGRRIRKIRITNAATGEGTVKTIYTFPEDYYGAGLALDSAGNLYAGAAGKAATATTPGKPHTIIKIAGAISL